MEKTLSRAQIKKLVLEIRSGTFRELPGILRSSPERIPKELFDLLAMYLEGKDRLINLEEIAEACGYKTSTIKAYRARGEVSKLKIPPLYKYGKRYVCLKSTLDNYLSEEYKDRS